MIYFETIFTEKLLVIFTVAMQHVHKKLAFAHTFKHCGLKTSNLKPLKCNQQRKRTHFSICAHCLRDVR